jgi:hypothetical protein
MTYTGSRTDVQRFGSPLSDTPMTSSLPLQGSELIDCARANATSGLHIAAQQCRYATYVSEFQQALAKACQDAGITFHHLNDLIQDHERIRGIEIAPENLDRF